MIGAIGTDGISKPYAHLDARVVHGEFLTFDRQVEVGIAHAPSHGQPIHPLRQPIPEALPPGGHLQ